MALDHGFQTALYVLTGLILAGAVIAVTLLGPKPAPTAVAASDDEVVVLESGRLIQAEDSASGCP